MPPEAQKNKGYMSFVKGAVFAIHLAGNAACVFSIQNRGTGILILRFAVSAGVPPNAT
jgi:hypothetical protein